MVRGSVLCDYSLSENLKFIYFAKMCFPLSLSITVHIFDKSCKTDELRKIKNKIHEQLVNVVNELINNILVGYSWKLM